jgi:hypothetical protein
MHLIPQAEDPERTHDGQEEDVSQTHHNIPNFPLARTIAVTGVEFAEPQFGP